MSTVVEMLNVTKTFGEGSSIVKALDGVDIRIEKGEFVAIVGASGSGKSTMMNLIGCLDRPTAGLVKVAGEDLSELNDKKLTSLRNLAIGFVFQSFFLLPKTDALDNVATPLFIGECQQKKLEKSYGNVNQVRNGRSPHPPINSTIRWATTKSGYCSSSSY